MHDFFMQQALQLAQDGLAQGELPIAALVVLDGQIIARATTAEKRQKRLLVHAELLALQTADQLTPFPGKRRDAILYSNLEPCLMCLGAAMSFFIGEIVYALESPSDGAVKLVQQWQRATDDFAAYRVPQIIGGVLREESGRLFQQYADSHSPGPVSAWACSLAKLVSVEK